jgi:hypothetical protein
MYLEKPPVHLVGNSTIAFFKAARSIFSTTISLFAPLYSTFIVISSVDDDLELELEYFASTDPDADTPS